jgi:hypothetical protein
VYAAQTAAASRPLELAILDTDIGVDIDSLQLTRSLSRGFFGKMFFHRLDSSVRVISKLRNRLRKQPCPNLPNCAHENVCNGYSGYLKFPSTATFKMSLAVYNVAMTH